jgi:hypothetical protein
VISALVLLAVVITTVARAAERSTARSSLHVVIFNSRDAAAPLTLTYERRLGIKPLFRYSRRLGGFAAHLNDSQVQALRRTARETGDITAVEPSGSVVLTASLRRDATRAGIEDLLSVIGLRPIQTYMRALVGFSAPFTAAQLGKLDQRHEVATINGHPWSYLVSVSEGIDGFDKSTRTASELDLPLRHSFPDWFSIGAVYPHHLARLEADPEVRSLEANQIYHAFDPWEVVGDIRMGVGLPQWRLGMSYRAESGLSRTESRPANRDCDGTVETARWIDHYPEVRLSWQNGVLTNVATTRWGVGTSTGFRIRTATVAQVRARFPTARFYHELPQSHAYWKSPYRLGRSLLIVTRRTAAGTSVTMHYWFDRAGTLVALETLRSGC